MKLMYVGVDFQMRLTSTHLPGLPADDDAAQKANLDPETKVTLVQMQSDTSPALGWTKTKEPSMRL